MKNQVTFSHVLVIMSIIVIPLLLWGVNVEIDLGKVKGNTKDIIENRAEIKDIKKQTNDKFDKILQELQDIKLQLKDKKDRE